MVTLWEKITGRGKETPQEENSNQQEIEQWDSEPMNTESQENITQKPIMEKMFGKSSPKEEIVDPKYAYMLKQGYTLDEAKKYEKYLEEGKTPSEAMKRTKFPENYIKPKISETRPSFENIKEPSVEVVSEKEEKIKDFKTNILGMKEKENKKDVKITFGGEHGYEIERPKIKPRSLLHKFEEKKDEENPFKNLGKGDMGAKGYSTSGDVPDFFGVGRSKPRRHIEIEKHTSRPQKEYIQRESTPDFFGTQSGGFQLGTQDPMGKRIQAPRRPPSVSMGATPKNPPSTTYGAPRSPPSTEYGAPKRPPSTKVRLLGKKPETKVAHHVGSVKKLAGYTKQNKKVSTYIKPQKKAPQTKTVSHTGAVKQLKQFIKQNKIDVSIKVPKKKTELDALGMQGFL